MGGGGGAAAALSAPGASAGSINGRPHDTQTAARPARSAETVIAAWQYGHWNVNDMGITTLDRSRRVAAGLGHAVATSAVCL